MVAAIVNSFLLVLVSEMGDKTQLLALVLAARFRRPWTIMLGILVATLLNHGLASWAGGRVAELVDATTLRWSLSFLFVAFGLWILIPDQEEELSREPKYGAFLTTVVTFFLAEMGDKTQLATVALGARFHDFWSVTAGTTAGMMVADGLAVLVGDRLHSRLPMVLLRRLACVLFIGFGLLIFFQVGM